MLQLGKDIIIRQRNIKRARDLRQLSHCHFLCHSKLSFTVDSNLEDIEFSSKFNCFIKFKAWWWEAIKFTRCRFYRTFQFVGNQWTQTVLFQDCYFTNEFLDSNYFQAFSFSPILNKRNKGKKSKMAVIFKNCVFEGLKKAVSISRCTAIFDGCVFKNCITGVKIYDYAILDFNECKFENVEMPSVREKAEFSYAAP